LLLLFVVCPVLFSFLYQLCFVETFKLKYLVSRSKCDFCNKQLRYRDIIPIFSYIRLFGKASCCKQTLSRCYILGEILSVVPALYTLFHPSVQALSTFICLYLFLLVFALFDIQTLSIPLHIFLIFAFVSAIIFEGHLNYFVIVTFFLHIFYFLFKHAIGYGDILICSLLSYLIPYSIFINILFLTFLLGSVISTILVLQTKKRKIKIPLIPFIYLAFCIETVLLHLRIFEVGFRYL